MSIVKQKLYSNNTQIKLNAIITNNLPISPKLKEVFLKENNENINLETISNELLTNKAMDNIGIIEKKSEYIIPITLKFNNNINYSGRIGEITLKWTDSELTKFSDKLFNSSVFSLSDIDSKQFDIQFNCEYIKSVKNKEIIPFKINLTNNTDDFKKIVFLIDNSSNFIISGPLKKKLLFYPLENKTIILKLIPLSFGKLKVPPFKIMEFPVSSVGYDNKIYSIYYLSESIDSVQI